MTVGDVVYRHQIGDRGPRRAFPVRWQRRQDNGALSP